MKLIYPDKYENKHIDMKTYLWVCDKICTKKVKQKHEIKVNKELRKVKQKHKIKVNKKLRAEILKRDNYKCTACGSNKNIHIHHIKYRSNGGTNEPENLISLCKHCHANVHKSEPIYKLMVL